MLVKELVAELLKLDQESAVYHCDGEYGPDEPIIKVVKEGDPELINPIYSIGDVYIWQ